MRREIVLIVVLLAVLACLLYFSKSLHTTSESDARKFFLENLAQNYPSADVREIMDVLSLDDGKTLRLKARVSSGLSTPCPERLHIYYNFPAKNFVYELENITSGCVVCRDTPQCVVLWPEEAIIASHIYPGSKSVEEYILEYPDATPDAAFLKEYAGRQNMWEVKWDSPSADYYILVHLSQTQNAITDAKSIQKQ